ncbi:MAG TPA: hypothetical protein VMN39_05825, partial [Longimicrobiaceae bacterium]|nr:hypothetical protein [Longimicrobiaceae bacterium]
MKTRRVEAHGSRTLHRGATRVAALLAALAAHPATAPAAAQVPAPAQTAPIALVNATVHTVSGGVIEGGTVVFEDGVITAVGTDVAVPAGAER